MNDKHAEDKESYSSQKNYSKKKISTIVSAILPTSTILLIGGIAWEIAARTNAETARIWSSPALIYQAFILNHKELFDSLSVTAYEGLAGFALSIVVGIVLGVALYWSKFINSAFLPLFTAAQTFPLIAITPFFLWWFGFEEIGKIVLVAVFSTFPIAIQTARGLRSVPEYYTDVALTCGATRLWTLWHIQLRGAGRQIFTGIRIAGTYIFAIATTAEYMGSRKGLGIFLQGAYNLFQSSLVWTATISIVLMTAIVIGLISLVEHFMLGDPSTDLID